MKSGPLKFWGAGVVVAGVLGVFLCRIKRTRPKEVEVQPESKAKLDLSGRYRSLFEHANDLMVMPEGMTGRDLAERLQVEKPKIKVLYSSGYSPDVVGGYFKLPENSFFLAKPYHPPKLAKAVRDCLDHASPGNLHQRDVAVAA